MWGIGTGSCCLGVSLNIHNQVGVVGVVGIVLMTFDIVVTPLLKSIRTVASHGGSTLALVPSAAGTADTCLAIPHLCARHALPLSHEHA